MPTGCRPDASIFTVESFDKTFHTHFPDRSESMDIKKLLIRESLLFTAYMWFGFLIFPAGLVAIYILVGGASKDMSFAGELAYFYKSCADGHWIALSAALGPYILHQAIRSIIRVLP
jgi:hypothetical protein